MPQTYTSPRRASFGALLQLPDFRRKGRGDDYLRLAAALCEIKRATLSRTQPSPHTGSCPGASAPSSGSISRPRALSEGPSCTVNQLSPLRFSLPHTTHRSFPDWFGSFVVTVRRARALTPRKPPPEKRGFTGHTKGLPLVLALIERLRRGFHFARCHTCVKPQAPCSLRPYDKGLCCAGLGYATANLASYSL